MSTNCKKCNGSGKIEYYHDAGDHFGGGTAPNSGWETKDCDCKQIYGPISQEEYLEETKKAEDIIMKLEKALKDIEMFICQTKDVCIKMFDAEESYGCGFYNQDDWNENYDKLKKIMEYEYKEDAKGE